MFSEPRTLADSDITVTTASITHESVEFNVAGTDPDIGTVTINTTCRGTDGPTLDVLSSASFIGTMTGLEAGCVYSATAKSLCQGLDDVNPIEGDFSADMFFCTGELIDENIFHEKTCCK